MNNNNKRSLDEASKKTIAFSQKWNCKKCKEILPSTYEIDHIVPFSITQDDSIDNLQALCPNCHRKKTQLENKRIIQFKKICAIKKSVLCWFCLETCIECGNSCNKVCKEIKFKKKSNFEFNNLDIFSYTKDTYKTLKIKLTPDVIWINNYFTDMEGFSDSYNVERIAKAVYIATKNTNDIYNNIEITIDFLSYTDEHVPDELIEHLDENLPLELKNKNISMTEEIVYTYICVED